VPQPEGEDYDTDNDLHYASDSDSGLQEEEQIFRSKFDVTWRIENYKCNEDGEFECLRELEMETRPQMRLLLPLDCFQQWYQDHMNTNLRQDHAVADLRDYRLKKIEFRADYDNGEEDGRKGMHAFRFGDQENYYDALDKLNSWRTLGHRGLKLSLIARVKKMSSTAATLVQRVRVPDLRMQLGTGGHPVAKIRRQWTCKRQDCERFGLTCWWGVKDLPKYHVPIRACHLRAWGWGTVEDGKLTPQDPGAALIQRMMRHQQARKTAGAPAPAAPDLNMNLYGMASTFQQTIQANGVNLHLSFFGPEYSLATCGVASGCLFPISRR
jgi:hypothetical protein